MCSVNISLIRSPTWWCHQMETFFKLLALCAGNSPVTGEFPHKSQWLRALMFSLIWAWTNGQVNNRDVGDLRCHCTHYDVTVMQWWSPHPGVTQIKLTMCAILNAEHNLFCRKSYSMSCMKKKGISRRYLLMTVTRNDHVVYQVILC